MSSQFVFGGISIGGGDAGGSPTPGVPSVVVTDDAQQIYARVYPDPNADLASSAPFNSVAGSYASGLNFVTFFGHNITGGGGPEDTDKPMIATSYEQNFDAGAAEGAEYHLIHRGNYVGAPTLRPMTFFLRNDAAPDPAEPSQYGAGFTVRSMNQDWAGDTLWACDTLNGFQINAAPLAVANSATDPARQLLTLSASSSQTGSFVRIIKNNTEFITVSQFGETLIYGPSSGAGAGALSAMLDVVGRTGTPNTFVARNADNDPVLQVLAGTGVKRTLVYGKLETYGGTFEISNAAGSAYLFRVPDSGGAQIWGTITAGGNLNAGLTVGTSGPGVYSGSGAPSIAAPKGSLYMRTDGSGVNDRMYVATDAAGTWTAVVTVA